MPPNQGLQLPSVLLEPVEAQRVLRCAVLGCGMMGQEHCSYIMGYPNDLRIDFLCDPHQPSLDKCLNVIKEFRSEAREDKLPCVLQEEDELIKHVGEIDLLVIASPNFLHTDTLLRWGKEDITILLEKPVAVSQEQHDRLHAFSQKPDLKARVWVAMEYRFIPAIAKLIELLPSVGEIKMCTIRENRYPFLHKIGGWNRDRSKTGDTLVEKCCHFFDLMRLITGQEAELGNIRALVQRGLNYEDEESSYAVPIIDSAYVTMPFCREERSKSKVKTVGCLELCMYAEGSRHQEEIIVTGTKGRLEAYLPENKVYAFERPSMELWNDRSVPPPPSSVRQTIHDCSNVKDVHGIETEIPTHGGYHYSSTAVEWYKLLQAIRSYESGFGWSPAVSLTDGMRAVEIGLKATQEIVDEHQVDGGGHPVVSVLEETETHEGVSEHQPRAMKPLLSVQ